MKLVSAVATARYLWTDVGAFQKMLHKKILGSDAVFWLHGNLYMHIQTHRYIKRKTYTYPLDILINLYNVAPIDYKQTIYSKTKLQLDYTGSSLLFHLQAYSH